MHGLDAIGVTGGRVRHQLVQLGLAADRRFALSGELDVAQRLAGGVRQRDGNR
jgi:hypothetical protein